MNQSKPMLHNESNLFSLKWMQCKERKNPGFLKAKVSISDQYFAYFTFDVHSRFKSFSAKKLTLYLQRGIATFTFLSSSSLRYAIKIWKTIWKCFRKLCWSKSYRSFIYVLSITFSMSRRGVDLSNDTKNVIVESSNCGMKISAM